jgi:hypothetical protein
VLGNEEFHSLYTVEFKSCLINGQIHNAIIVMNYMQVTGEIELDIT